MQLVSRIMGPGKAEQLTRIAPWQFSGYKRESLPGSGQEVHHHCHSSYAAELSNFLLLCYPQIRAKFFIDYRNQLQAILVLLMFLLPAYHQRMVVLRRLYGKRTRYGLGKRPSASSRKDGETPRAPCPPT